MIKKLFLTLAFSFLCLFAYAASPVTYYFDAYDAAGEEWQQNPANMSDGSIETHAYTQLDEDINLLDSNTCDGTNLGTISKVELRNVFLVIKISAFVLFFRTFNPLI